jgi:xylulokinase
MATEFIIGIDLGTSGCKTVLVDRRGGIAATGYREYPLHIPQQGWYEQNPLDWWKAAQGAVKTMLARSRHGRAVRAIGLSGQMHGLVAVDAVGEVLRPCMIWADTRNEEQCEQIHRLAGGVKGLLKHPNNRMLAGYTGGKLLWMREHEPEVFEKMKVFLNPKDYLRFRLTGEFGADVSDASGTGLFDVRHRRWAFELIDRLKLSRNLFSKCHESCDVAGALRVDVASNLGLPAGIPVVAGGGDAVVQSTGTGLIEPGVFGITIGTGGVVTTALPECRLNVEGRYQVFCHNAPDQWIVMGVSLTAGGALRWLASILAGTEKEAAAGLGTDVYALLDQAAARISPGAEGLFFMPHLVGQRCPYPDSASRAAFIGLTLKHTKAHLIRSLLEGVAYSVCEITDFMQQEMRTRCRELRLTGGACRSQLWKQIHADVFGCDVHTLSGASEGAAYGAAMLAGVGSGLWKDLKDAAAALRATETTVPIDTHVRRYRSHLALYRKLHPNLRAIFAELSSL